MNDSLFDSVTGAEFLLGDDGRYYHGGIGYEVKEGDKSPLDTGGQLVATMPNTPTLPKQGAGPTSQPVGKLEYRALARAMIRETMRGRSPDAMAEKLIKTTSPLQVVQQGAMEAFMDLYAQLEPTDRASLDPFVERYDADPMFSAESFLSEVSRAPGVSPEVQQQVLNIVARFNLSIPK